MVTTAALAGTAALVGDPARAAMLSALLDGRALTAGELAAVAGVAPQTASGHLARLAEAGLLAAERQGRHRYHRLASADVARMLEAIMAVAGSPSGPPCDRPPRARPPRTGPRDAALRDARTCYDHLAGRLAVALADAMVTRGHLEWTPDGGRMTAAGGALLRDLGVVAASAGTRPFCRPCLDWSERRPHIGGALGAALCGRCVALGWVRRAAGTRAVTVTPAGRLGLRHAFGVEA